jgi:hypothetical protein
MQAFSFAHDDSTNAKEHWWQFIMEKETLF